MKEIVLQTDPRPLVFLNPGEVFVTNENIIIETVLGSCVAVAIWDSVNKIGGMNHVVLSGINVKNNGSNTKFAYGAMNAVANQMVKLGSQKAQWKAYIIGGAKQFDNANYKVGDDNVEMVKRWLKHHNVPIKMQDVAGNFGRVIKFEPAVGRLNINYIKKTLLP